MTSQEELFSFTGTLMIKNDPKVASNASPADEAHNWFLANINNNLWGFRFTITDVAEVGYGRPFNIRLGFLASDKVRPFIETGIPYQVFRNPLSKAQGTLTITE